MPRSRRCSLPGVYTREKYLVEMGGECLLQRPYFQKFMVYVYAYSLAIDMHCVHLYCSGLEELESAGLQYLDLVFSEPGRSGALLICGLASSSGSGCGKSSLAKLLCKSASHLPYCVHISMIDCTSLRGKVWVCTNSNIV